jgi:hypothetical protein
MPTKKQDNQLARLADGIIYEAYRRLNEIAPDACPNLTNPDDCLMGNVQGGQCKWQTAEECKGA